MSPGETAAAGQIENKETTLLVFSPQKLQGRKLFVYVTSFRTMAFAVVEGCIAYNYKGPGKLICVSALTKSQ